VTTPVEARQPMKTSPRGLGRLLASTGVSMIGQGAVTAAVPLLAASLTRNPLLVSVVAASTYAAWLVVGLPAGALVDRWPRRRVMVASDLIRAALLVLVSTAVAFDRLPIVGLVVMVFLIASAGCFFDPAAQAAIPVLAGREPATLAKANGRLWVLDSLGRSLLGPPIGAALFATLAVLPFALNGATFVVSAVLLVGIAGLGRPKDPSVSQPVRRAVAEGVSYLVRHPGLRLLTLGMASYNLGYNVAFATFVLFAQDRLSLGPKGFGVLLSMLAVGGIVGGWVGARLHVRLSAAWIYSICLGVQAASWLVVLTLESVWMTGVALVVVGLASTVVSVVGGTARQTLTPDHLLGRITSGTRVVGIGSAAVGSVIGGEMASLGTLGTPLVVAASVLLVGAVAFAVSALSRRS
jgi:MFS family permease